MLNTYVWYPWYRILMFKINARYLIFMSGIQDAQYFCFVLVIHNISVYILSVIVCMYWGSQYTKCSPILLVNDRKFWSTCDFRGQKSVTPRPHHASYICCDIPWFCSKPNLIAAIKSFYPHICGNTHTARQTETQIKILLSELNNCNYVTKIRNLQYKM